MGDVVLTMSLVHASTLGVAARAVADTAAVLGLGDVERTQLEAIMSEALTAVIADSFEGADTIDVDVTVTSEPGQLLVVLHQRGAPSTYVSGGLPERLETLLSLGYADSLVFLSDGVQGSELQITRSLGAATLIDDADFVASAEYDSDVTLHLDDVTIRPISPDDVIEVARLYFRVYGYTKIGSPWIYEPDAFRHKLSNGLHEAVVAVIPSGRIVGHVGILRSSPTSVAAAGGPIAVDPACRRSGLADRMGAQIHPTLLSLGLRGLSSEAVTAHPASQHVTRKLGGREVGLILGRQPAELDFLGFDGPSGFRRAVMVFYSPYGTPPESTVHIPPRYRGIVERIYAECGLPRAVGSDGGRPPSDLPDVTRFSTQLTSVTRFARIDVLEYGRDFLTALQGLLRRFQREQFEVITLHLPLESPLTAFFGAGLEELGLSFNAVFPDQDRGDELVLGMCMTDQDPDTIAVASDFGAELRDFVIGDRATLSVSADARARARASMARVLDAL